MRVGFTERVRSQMPQSVTGQFVDPGMAAICKASSYECVSTAAELTADGELLLEALSGLIGESEYYVSLKGPFVDLAGNVRRL